MWHALEWFLFGMFVWGCCIVMSAFSRRYAPELGDDKDTGSSKYDAMSDESFGSGFQNRNSRKKDAEIRELKERIETLEAIVTDQKYRWEQEFSSDK